MSPAKTTNSLFIGNEGQKGNFDPHGGDSAKKFALGSPRINDLHPGLIKVPPFSTRKGIRLRFAIADVGCYSEGIDASITSFISISPLVFASVLSSS